MNEDKEIALFVKEIHKSLQRYGVKKIIEKLKELKIDNSEIEEQQLIDLILFKIFEAYQVRINQLRFSKKHGIIADARKMAFVLFNKHIAISQKEIANFFKRKNHTTVSIALREFKLMNKQIKIERDFLETYESIDKQINEYKEEMIKKYSKNLT